MATGDHRRRERLLARRPWLVLIAVALLASGRAADSWSAIEAPVPETIDARASLVRDPVRTGAATTALVSVEGRNLVATAYGPAGARLARASAGDRIDVRGSTRLWAASRERQAALHTSPPPRCRLGRPCSMRRRRCGASRTRCATASPRARPPRCRPPRALHRTGLRRRPIPVSAGRSRFPTRRPDTPAGGLGSERRVSARPARAAVASLRPPMAMGR